MGKVEGIVVAGLYPLLLVDVGALKEIGQDQGRGDAHAQERRTQSRCSPPQPVRPSPLLGEQAEEDIDSQQDRKDHAGEVVCQPEGSVGQGGESQAPGRRSFDQAVEGQERQGHPDEGSVLGQGGPRT